MNKTNINRKKIMQKKPLVLTMGFVWFVFVYAVAITSFTYAYNAFTATATGTTGEGGCFQVSYTGQNLNAGELLSTTNYLEGAHTTITLSKDSTCKIYTEANIYLKTNNTTTAPIATTPALRYKILEQTNNTLIEEGLVNSSSEYLLTTVPITDTETTYIIYIWIDAELSGGAYDNKSYSGYIYAESVQSSTVEN